MEEFLTIKELSQRIKLAKQTIYNFIHLGKFVLGKHYLKPTPKKILFKWSEIQGWMGEGNASSNESDDITQRRDTGPGAETIATAAKPRSSRPAKSLINI